MICALITTNEKSKYTFEFMFIEVKDSHALLLIFYKNISKIKLLFFTDRNISRLVIELLGIKFRSNGVVSYYFEILLFSRMTRTYNQNMSPVYLGQTKFS